MLKVIDLVYYSHNDIDKPGQVLNIHAPALGFAPYIKDKIDLQFVKHLNYEGAETIDEIKYSFFKNSNSFWHIPFKTHRYIKSQQPDIVIVEGLIFPLQLMMLKLQLGRRTRVIAQHHNEKPFPGIKGFFQKMADRCISRYLFTCYDDATEWLNAKILGDKSKCREVLEASTYFSKKDKKESQASTGMSGVYNFLWVGSLSNTKDPITVLKGFEKFISVNLIAKLYMIYQEEALLPAVKKIIEQNDQLKNAVVLVGKINHDQLPYWFSAASFYISGSHREASSYSLLEAMACGCVPVVTDIPSFRKITAEGKFAFLYPPGNVEALAVILNDLQKINIDEYATKVENHFTERLSFKNIADDLYTIFNQVV